MKYIYRRINLALIAILICLGGTAQVAPPQDITKIQIENLSEQQLVQLMNKTGLSGVPIDQIEQKAIQAGFTSDQAAKLKMRAAGINRPPSAGSGNADYSRNDPTKTERINPGDFTTVPKTESRIFGAEFFSNQNLTFEPNLKIATPSNYILGPGDKVTIDVFGYSDIQYKLEVTPDGNIRIPNIGPVFVSGLSIEEAKVRVRRALSTVFKGLLTGNTSFQMVLTEIRSIQVTIIGEVMHPASYTLPSLATIANALYLSGGPTVNGSLRYIDLMRDGKKIVSFDFYDFLLRGDLSKNVLLRDQDVIRISPYKTHVELSGAVKRQAIFEVKPTESITDVIEFAGGFADTANTELITAYRVAGREKEIINIPIKDISKFTLRTGDSVVVNGVINRFRNRVVIKGAVFYEGNYSLSQVPTLKNLLEMAQLKEGAFKRRAIVRRLQEDFTPSYIDFNIYDVMSGKQNIDLVREDSVHIFDVMDIKERYTVSINGEVNQPGTFDFADSMKLQDLVLAARGFKDGASNKRVEIARRMRKGNISDSSQYAIVKVLDLNDDFSYIGAIEQYVLQPFDIVSIRKSPDYKEQVIVKVEGEVKYPGDYSIQGRTERLSDLIRRAGGLKTEAYPEGALLSRKTYESSSASDTTLQNSKLKILGGRSEDTTTIAGRGGNLASLVEAEKKPVGIRLNEAMAAPGSTYDIFLEDGDVLKVPKKLQTVQTFGAVNMSQKIVYREGMDLSDAVRESGGYAAGAIKGRSYVVQANGEVKATSHFLFFNFYPKLKPGAEVYVPSKGTPKPLSAAELIGISTSIAGLGAIVVSLISLLK